MKEQPCSKGVRLSACIRAQDLIVRLGSQRFSCDACTAETVVPELIVSRNTSNADADALFSAFGGKRLGPALTPVTGGRCLHSRKPVSRLCGLSDCTSWIDMAAANNCSQVLRASCSDSVPVSLLAAWLKTNSAEVERRLAEIQATLRGSLINDVQSE